MAGGPFRISLAIEAAQHPGGEAVIVVEPLDHLAVRAGDALDLPVHGARDQPVGDRFARQQIGRTSAERKGRAGRAGTQRIGAAGGQADLPAGIDDGVPLGN